jgi:hypothetical protein
LPELPESEDERLTVREFFSTLPEAGVLLWEFMEGFYGVAIALGSFALAALFLFLAKIWRDNHSWLSAIAGVSGGSILFWWAFGIIPSAFTYFVDGERDVFEGTLLPGQLPGMDNAYEVLRDVTVVGMQTLFVVVFLVAMLRIQRRYPRSLAEGEEKTPVTGGYR